jgi:hypothetical protein
MSMRDLFPGYYAPPEEELSQLWENCLFVFDTNMLLNIYRYQPVSRESFFEVLKKLNDRIWIPYQVALEYQGRRLQVISDQMNAYDTVIRLLDETLSGIKKRLNSYRERHSFIDPTQLLTPITSAIDETKTALRTAKKEHPNLKKSDQLRDTIDELFMGKIGNRYSETELENKYKEAEQRLEWKIPPGYEDEDKKGPKKYGDTILWFQIIDYACSQRRPIVFVTDDTKEDWWLLHRDRPNQEHPQPLGPRPELIQEMFLKADVPFYMYQGYQFVAKAQKFLDLKSLKEVIDDIRDVGQQFDTVVTAAALRRNLAEAYIARTKALTGDFDLVIQNERDKNLVAELYRHLQQLVATNAISESTGVEEIATEYSCDRCGRPMSAQEYDQLTICDNCWKDVTYEKEVGE